MNFLFAHSDANKETLEDFSATIITCADAKTYWTTQRETPSGSIFVAIACETYRKRQTAQPCTRSARADCYGVLQSLR